MSKFSSPIFILTSLLLVMPGMAEQGLYKKISPACVEILVGGRLDGSGAIVCSSGLVLTACHVIRKQKQEIRSALSPQLGRKQLNLIATYRGSDLALLRLPKSDTPYPALPLAKSIPTEGKRVFLLGSPIFRHHLLLERNHSQKKRILFLVQRWVHQYHTDQRNRSPWFIRRSLGKSKG